MAAPPSKPSPTNRPVDQPATAADNAKAQMTEPTTSAATAAVNNDTNTSTTPITYQSVEQSDAYLLAKRHLNDGKFEEAMVVIEEAIRDTQELLKQQATAASNEDFALHESMAPLHYLYGTTLLYSIEESSDSQEMTMAGASAVAAPAEAVPAPVAAAANNNDEDEAEAAAQQPPIMSAADVADEMEISWENFEAARAIIEQMMTSITNVDDHLTAKLELDLAQIYLREGDLQRMNGRYEHAIQDYHSCLRFREKSKFIEEFDRKVADVHYNLAMVYMLQASDSKEEENNSDAGDVGVARSKEQDEKLSEAKRSMSRNKGVFHYLECSKCFCGQIAIMCNADANSVIQGDGDDDQKPSAASLKATGEEEHDDMELPQVASAKLKAMRDRAATLAATADVSGDRKLDVDDLLELLQEIQETVDESEEAAKGVQEVINMKEEVSKLAAADPDIGEASGSTTQIGFGNPTAVAAAAAAARPMMVVKKKKRPADPAKQPAGKKPKPESE